MQSIRYLYQIGYGPSSSHTMGPSAATRKVKITYPEANRFEITLFNSLALTGRGHLTEDAIKESLSDCDVTFFTTIDITKHPNYLWIKAYQDDRLIAEKGASRVGG